MWMISNTFSTGSLRQHSPTNVGVGWQSKISNFSFEFKYESIVTWERKKHFPHILKLISLKEFFKVSIKILSYNCLLFEISSAYQFIYDNIFHSTFFLPKFYIIVFILKHNLYLPPENMIFFLFLPLSQIDYFFCFWFFFCLRCY